jgi:hypothetical protein
MSGTLSLLMITHDNVGHGFERNSVYNQLLAGLHPELNEMEMLI